MRKLVLLTVILAGPLDVGLTLLFWSEESNPVVLTLGPILFTVVKTLALGGLTYLWVTTEIQEHRIARVCLYGLCTVYSVVAVTNVWHLLQLSA